MIDEKLDLELDNDELDDIEPIVTEPQLYEHFRVVVDKGQEMVRVDKYLFDKITNASRNRIQKAADAGYVMANGKSVKSRYKVKPFDIITLMLDRPRYENEIIPQDIPLDVVYEDDSVIVVNKPAGMTVHIGAGAYSGTLVNALLFHCQGRLSGIGGVKRPGIVHRIDKETSGLLVVAKNDNAHRFLSEQFAEHSIERTYYAIVYGVPEPLSGRIEGNIARSNFDRKKMAMVQTGGKTAITNYKTLQTFGRAAAMMQCNLETGRTHQIRVHLSSKGNNLIGDKVYEKAKKTSIIAPDEVKKYINSFPRQALHAASIGFVHPKSKTMMNFSAPLPDDMKELLSVLQKI